MHLHGFELIPVLDELQIKNRVSAIGDELSKKFKDEIPILIGVLNSSFIFMADLIRAIDIDCETDFIKISSYDRGSSKGTVRLLKDISADITGRHVVIIEDIIDSGLTIRFIKDRMGEADPKSLTIVSLLLKPGLVNLDFPIDIVGFEIAPDFVVGYGLDYDQKLRHLPAIYRIEKANNVFRK